MIFFIAQIIFYVLDPVLHVTPYIGAYCIIDDFVQIVKAPIEEKAGLKLYVVDKPIKTTVTLIALVTLRNVAYSIIKS